MEFTRGRPFIYTSGNKLAEEACDVCDKHNIKLFVCGKCKYTHYCSKECQTEAWKRIHKQLCKPYTNFNPYTYSDQILNRKDVKDALNLYSRFSPRITGKYTNNTPNLVYFHLVCVNMFEGEHKRSGIYMIMKLAPLSYVERCIEAANNPALFSMSRLRDVFIVRFSFYMREDTEKEGVGKYYFMDTIEKMARVPEVTDETTIRDKDKIQEHAQIFGNIAIDTENFDLITSKNEIIFKDPFLCKDCYRFIKKENIVGL